MKSFFDDDGLGVMLARLEGLRADGKPLWGKMSAAQMLEHNARAFEVAMDLRAPGKAPWLIRAIGRLMRAQAFNDKPMPRNSPTARAFVVSDEREFDASLRRLKGLMTTFSQGGPAVVSAKPHGFFGPLTPRERGMNLWKHLDHHLKQFGL